MQQQNQFDNKYDTKKVEKEIYLLWQKYNVFASGRRKKAKPYTIVLPPPNVTGSLHLGHALGSSLQDILCRFRRLQGYDVLWQPGTDHAGIATQMVVERNLQREGLSRQQIGRKAFIEKTWQWKEKSGGTIIKQLQRLGASCDWQRERFTMDEGLSHAVRVFFVRLYEDGLVLRQKGLVNWDPKLLTAISDLEVVQKQVKGNLWYIRYPLQNNQQKSLVVATTRPETMFGDTAVAVNPQDERYKNLIGQHVILPFSTRKIPVIADHYADPDQGSGVVKITPAHDFNDFEVGQRHNLDKINILTKNGRLNDEVPQKYRNLDRFEARAKIVADLQNADLLLKVDDITHNVPYGDRSGVVIEPYLTDQWYVDAKKLAIPAIKVVQEKQVQFVPDSWTKTYLNWMNDIRVWCVSRQLWWGHQIPAWYAQDGKVFVALDEDKAYQKAQEYYGTSRQNLTLTQDQDVLDTWFSSALWPFSTMGWPQQTDEMKRYYPNSVMVTGFDIIFFWVARMIMAGIYCTKKPPFQKICIHALIRDQHGQKMSKSKGNVIDPIDIIDEFGADALRFTLAALSVQGRDIKLAKNRVEGYRNFVTKLWNLFRFCKINGVFEKNNEKFDVKTVKAPHNQWIIALLAKLIDEVTQHLEQFKFNLAAQALYRFIWYSLCDWYIELSKPLLSDDDAAVAAETRSTIRWVSLQAITLLHPFMPFVTEKIWQQCFLKTAEQKTKQQQDEEQNCLALQKWPKAIEIKNNDAIEYTEIAVQTIKEIRSIRSILNVPPGAYVRVYFLTKSDKNLWQLIAKGTLADAFKKLARVEFACDSEADMLENAPQGTVMVVNEKLSMALEFAQLIDVENEARRIDKNKRKIHEDLTKVNDKLQKKEFINNAPQHVIDEMKQRLLDFQEKINKLQIALQQLNLMQKNNQEQ